MVRFAPLATLVAICLVPLLMGQNTKDGVPQPAPITAADIAAMAPVKSVNTQTGDVVLQTFQRAVGTLTSFTSAGGYVLGTWSYTTKVNGVDTPFTFAAPPRCFMQIRSASASVTFTYPVVTSVTASTVSFRFAAQPISISLAGLTSLSLLASTPADTAVDIMCLNPI